MYLMKCYWMLQNASVTAFTISKLLRQKQRKEKSPPPHTQPQLWLLKKSAISFAHLKQSIDTNRKEWPVTLKIIIATENGME